MSRRTLLAIVLAASVAALHGIVALSLSSKIVFKVSVAAAQRVFGSSVAEKQIFDDVDIYRRYSGLAVAGRIPYRDFAVEYPVFAFPLFLIPRLLASRSDHYRRHFAVEMLLFDAIIVFLVFTRIRRDEGIRAALLRLGWYSLAMAFLWSLPISRFDLAPTALAFTGAVGWGSGRGAIGGMASGIGALMKIFPGLVTVPASFAIAPGEPRWRGRIAFASTVAVGLLLWIGLGGAGVVASLAYHVDRGLEAGSIPANLLILWTLATGGPLSTAFRHTCSELVCPGADGLAAWSTPIMGLMMLIVFLRFRNRGIREVVRASGASILGFLVVGKVLSPQYVLWGLPFVAVLEGRAGRIARPLFLMTCALTSLAYPWSYMGLIAFHPLAVAILSARNASLLILFGIFLSAGEGPESMADARWSMPNWRRKSPGKPAPWISRVLGIDHRAFSDPNWRRDRPARPRDWV